MKALIRLVSPHGEPPRWIITPQPTAAEIEERKGWPDDIRFEAVELNIISTGQDCTDWTATRLRERVKG